MMGISASPTGVLAGILCVMRLTPSYHAAGAGPEWLEQNRQIGTVAADVAGQVVVIGSVNGVVVECYPHAEPWESPGGLCRRWGHCR